MLRRILRPGIVVGIIALVAVAARGEEESAPKVEKAGDKAAIEMLGRKIERFNWEKVTVEKALTELAGKIGPKVAVDRAAIEKSGMKTNEIVTISLTNALPGEVLWAISASSNDLHDLAFAVEDGKITITTYSESTHRTFLQSYDMSDLTRAAEAGADAQEKEKAKWELPRLVSELVAPMTWAEINDSPTATDGEAPYGALKLTGTKLAVTSTAAVHMSVARFLEVLRGKGPAFNMELAASDPDRKRFEEFRWVKTALPKVIAEVGATIGIDADALAPVSDFHTDDRITLAARGVTVEELFKLMALVSKEDFPFGDFVTSQTLMKGYGRDEVISVFDVSDLLGADAKKIAEARQVDDERAAGVMNLIAGAAESERWMRVGEWPRDPKGTSLGTMHALGCRVIIQSPRDMQWKVAAFLESLRKPSGVERAQRALEKRVERVSWKFATLPEALSELAGKFEMHVIVDRKAMERAKIQAESYSSLALRSATLPEALSLLSLAAGLPEPLGCYVVGGNVVITTQGAAQKQVVTAVYDVSDLANEQKKEEQFEFLEMVTRIVDDGGWKKINNVLDARAAYGAEGEVTYYKGKLIVKATGENQLRVEATLGTLRKTAAGAK